MNVFFGMYCLFYLFMVVASILEKVKIKRPASTFGTVGLLGMGLITIIYGLVN